MTDELGIIKFPLKTRKKHFTGTILFEGLSFDYDILFTPLNKHTKGYDYVVKNISKRIRNGKPCLGLDEKTISSYLDRKITSAYGFVRETGKDDEASGAIQIYNWCSEEPSTMSTSQVWIGDLCRYSPSKYKSSVSPTKILIFLFEQLTADNTPINKINLMVDKKERDPLERIYKSYGFKIMKKYIRQPLDEDTTNNVTLLMMEKQIVIDDEYVNFPFRPLNVRR